MARNYLIELNPTKCHKCGNIVHALIRSKEEFDTFLCHTCKETINIIPEELKEQQNA